MRRSLALLASALIACAGSAAHAVDPTLALPTYTAAYEPTNVDERGLWMQADEAERRMRDSPLRIRDGNLEKYLLGVLCREVGQERCAGVRLYAMEDPQFNASMMPNGAMFVQSGFLLRVRNEGELAAVLGHEFAHFELRHGLNGFKNRRTGTDVMAWVTVLGGISNTPTGSTQLSLVGSIFRFNRDQETAADLLGLKYIAQSGYPAHSASEIWKSLMAEQEATARGRKLKAKQHFTAGFFDTHPTPLSRAVYLAQEADKLPAGGDPRKQELQDALAPYLPRFLAAQNKLNDFGGTDYILSNLAARSGWTSDLLFARGELYRARANPRDLQLASQFYREAKAAGYAAPDLDRNLGLALIRNGQVEEGRAALSAYLMAAPEASDAAIIHTLMAN
ncbi:M48 family metalloprotease [Novosphingobium panipatense]|jgi:predicted Zn-dependent protease|uniref:M48 family metallopeptidase n=1 Tax=Novosphingobium TaxID=165696 RepID=UPI000CDAB0A3|nr:M48 family metallopeptidase [Novosphingobium sp. HII-3]